MHASGIAWDDPSGDRLRKWLGVDKPTFHDESRIAIMPMGLCYPSKGKSGNLPPRPECVPAWHDKVLMLLPNIELTLLIVQYAQAYDGVDTNLEEPSGITHTGAVEGHINNLVFDARLGAS